MSVAFGTNEGPPSGGDVSNVLYGSGRATKAAIVKDRLGPEAEIHLASIGKAPQENDSARRIAR